MNNSEPNKILVYLSARPYTATIALLGICLLLLAGLLAFIANAGSTRLVDFSLKGQDLSRVEPYYQSFSWEFSRPLAAEMRSKLPELIKFEPSLPGNFRLVEDTILFTPSQSLIYSTSYKITLSNELQDLYNHKLSQDYVFEFKTKNLQLAYTRPATDGSDLMLAEFGEGEPAQTAVLSGRNIKEYAGFQDKLAIVVQDFDSEPSRLYQFDLGSGNLAEVLLPTRLNISSVDFDRRGRLLFLGAIPDADFADIPNEQIPEVLTKPYIYDLETQQLSELTALKNYYNDISEMRPLPDGNSVLLQNYNYDFMIVSLLNGETSLLGKFNDYGDASLDGKKLGVLEINFGQVNFVPQAKVYTSNGFAYESGPKQYAKDPHLSSRGDLFAYAARQKELAFAEGLFKLKVVDLSSKPQSVADISQSGASLELPRFSPDVKYIAAESISEAKLNDLQRDVRRFFNPGRPTAAEIVIYAHQVEKGVNKFAKKYSLGKGYNAIWVY
jgi:hypothetical protein